MASVKTKAAESSEYSIEDKLNALYQLQKVHSGVDKIKILRGELPLEVQDLEDEIVGLETRIQNYQDEIKSLELRNRNLFIVLVVLGLFIILGSYNLLYLSKKRVFRKKP